MEVMMATWLALGVGVLPLLGLLLWWWNDLWYNFTTKDGSGNVKLPPGYMGLPFFGEMLSLLWYFKVVSCPDDYINSKRKKYGDGVGMYRSYLFGTPCIIVCSPSANKFVFQSEETSFFLKWPNVELVGKNSLVSVHGQAHIRVRNFVSRSINQPYSLRKIALVVQPLMIASLESWAKKGKITAQKEVKKVTFENIGKYFASFEPGPILDSLDKCFVGLVKGFRAFQINIPGTAYYHGLQCRKKAVGIFREELEKRKKKPENCSDQPINDLLDGLTRLKDEEGNQLSDVEVLDNIVSLLVAGYESTALASTWAIYYLAKFPKVLHKLREETMSLKNSKNEELVTSDEIFKLKYMNKVVEETIRMANVAPFVFRTAAKDVYYNGYKIPKGWKVAIWIRYLHTSPKYFEDPMCFNPDRWDTIPRAGTYQVFGGGSRLCPGNMLARLQLSVFLYHLTTGYRWELVNPNAKVIYLPNPKLADGVEITIEKLGDSEQF